MWYIYLYLYHWKDSARIRPEKEVLALDAKHLHHRCQVSELVTTETIEGPFQLNPGEQASASGARNRQFGWWEAEANMDDDMEISEKNH